MIIQIFPLLIILKVIKLIDQDKYQIEQILEGHTFWIFKVIEIKENELISISFDKTMKIWKLNKKNKFECITTIIFQNKNSNCNLLKLNEKEFVTSSCQDECLKFWNLNNYSLITYIDNIKTPWPLKTLSLLANDILCVGGGQSKGFYFIKISTHQIMLRIKGPRVIFSLIKCQNNSFAVSMLDEKSKICITKYKFENDDFIKIFENKNAHIKLILTLTELNNGEIVTGSNDGIIKFWI